MQKTLFKVIQRLEADDSLMRFDVVSQSVDELKSLLKHSHETKPPETGGKAPCGARGSARGRRFGDERRPERHGRGT
jgi:hypothetical protein